MRKIILILSAAGALLCALFSPAVSAAALDAAKLCASVLAPSLFPFFVCANLLLSLGGAEILSKGAGRIMRPLFCVRDKGALPLILGLISGYPCGAVVTCKMYDAGSLSKNEAERLMAFSNNAGPMFIISAVGNGLFGNSQVGFLIYLSHVAGAFLCGITLSFFAKKEKTSVQKYKNRHTGASDAVPNAVMSILNLSGYVIFFSVILAIMKSLGFIDFLCRILCAFGTERKCAEMLSSGIFEITSGLFSSGCKNIPCAAALISIGGASVFLQTMSFAAKSGLSLKYYIAGKLFSGGAAAATARLLLRVFPVSVKTFAPAAVFETSPYMYFAAALLLSFPLIFLFFPDRR
ncbi:MAG: hypothetical protein J5590_06060 [Clostridia bacterium]|nr:hypothetical protein [Clostridia bacterium]